MDSTFRPAALLMSARAFAFGATFFIPVVLARVFDQAEFGTYKQLFLIYATLYGIAQVGMAESLFYFLPGTPRRGGGYALNALIVLVVAGLICLGVLEVAGDRISQWLGNSQLAEHLSLIGVYLLLMLASAGLEIGMIARKRYRSAAFSYGLSDLLRAVSFILPGLLLRRLEWVILGGVAFAALRVCATLLYLRREFRGELKPDVSLLKAQLGYALPFELAVLVEILQSNFHQYAVSYHFDAATFAIYAVGCLQIPMVEFLAGSAANVMMVRMSEKVRDGCREAVPTIWCDTTRKLALVFFPLVGLLLVVAPELIVLLFTEAYSGSIPVFMIWSTAILFAAVPTDGVLRVYADTRALLRLNTMKLLLTVASINWFLSAFDLVGAVIVSVGAAFAGKIAALIRVREHMRLGLAELLPWRSLAAIAAVAAVAGVPALIVRAGMGTSPVPVLLTVSLVYTLAYVALASWIVLSSDERRAVAGIVGRVAGNVSSVGELARVKEWR